MVLMQSFWKRFLVSGIVHPWKSLRVAAEKLKKAIVSLKEQVEGIQEINLSGGGDTGKTNKCILSDVLKCLGDNKKHMRESTLTTLDAWLAAVHRDKMVPYITTALMDAKLGTSGRKDLFDWLSRQLSGLSNFPDAYQDGVYNSFKNLGSPN
ncbi:Protein MOR1 [Camellia lanceoleosa]|uniref:Protein MOR1 n=1 Tax=Camellia lanceoleosa TaxID=1840588 RepID=A0ACC0I6S5_9ERIC|nr:Protein MOR1 [Camellia lanceoleosa]